MNQHHDVAIARVNGDTPGQPLHPGDWVEGVARGWIGRADRSAFVETYTTRWHGYYDGIRDDEGDTYVYFRDGYVGGVTQTSFGFPLDQLLPSL